MIDVKKNSKIKLHWHVSPYDYSKEASNNILAKISKKYGLSKDRIKIIPEFIMVDDNGEEISLTNDVIQSIQEPQFQIKLFNDWLKLNNISDYDFELIKKNRRRNQWKN